MNIFVAVVFSINLPTVEATWMDISCLFYFLKKGSKFALLSVDHNHHLNIVLNHKLDYSALTFTRHCYRFPMKVLVETVRTRKTKRMKT